MKKVALVFVVAVFVPSLVLAWLAVRSVRDQQFLLERQQSLLYQGVVDGLARQLAEVLTDHQHLFASKVQTLLRERAASDAAKSFDAWLRQDWPVAQVGFVVSLTGEILSPSPYDRPEARAFCADNGRFLANRESVEVYSNPKLALNTAQVPESQGQNLSPSKSDVDNADRRWGQNRAPFTRSVIPQQQANYLQKVMPQEETQQQFSKVAASEAEFRQLIGDASEGTLARFVDNKLNVLVWCRPPGDPQLIFGAQLGLTRLVEDLRPLLEPGEAGLQQELCIALLDDNARPAALTRPGFRAHWKRPFVATEIGEALPHWEVAAYLLDPARLTESARIVKLTLGLLIALLVLAIGTGSWLIVADMNRQLRLARLKTDFVSNVSHELKTPLTSIRMFSELLAEGRVLDPAKARSYLGIITAEAARLTRLINNVLDFARLERGEKKYHFQKCDLTGLVRETAATYRPHLEASGFQFQCELPETSLMVNGDRDALAQVFVNLLSNAEKYSDSRKEIEVQVRPQSQPLPHAEINVLDRGLGVPRGCEEKIFEQFYRAHDALSNGIQGSGLGLTLARQIARAHGGDVVYQRRQGEGSCFSLRLPLLPGSNPQSE